MGFGFDGLGALLSGGSVADATTQASGGDAAVFGTKPKVAAFTPTDLQAEQQRVINANISNSADLDRLLNSILPGYTDMRAQGSQNTLSLLRGEIPQDVQDRIRRDSAFQSLIGGYAGSGMSRALTARDLGRTSLDLTRMGENSAQLWGRLASGVSGPYLGTTQEQVDLTRSNNRDSQNTQQHQFNVDAAPNPAAAGKFAIDSAIGMKLLDFGVGAAGGAIGGAGGAGASRGAQGAGASTGSSQYGPYYNLYSDGGDGRP